MWTNKLSVDDDQNHSSSATFLDLNETNRYIVTATNWSIAVWAFLLALVYSITPTEELVYLNPMERGAALIAFCGFIVATILLPLPFLIQRRLKEMSPIIYAAAVVQIIAMITNGMLTFCPVPVKVDPITHSPVYLLRWCEWIPLGGLMTFLSEAVLIKNNRKDLQDAIYASLAQTISCLAGGIFCAYSPDPISWSFNMFIALATWAIIFPRLHFKRQDYIQATSDPYIPLEAYERVRFSYHLMLTCSIVWAVLVVFYGINAYVHMVLPLTHPLRELAPAMVADTLFDVLAKAFYMKCILDVHFAVFDAQSRALHQLSELRSLMSVLWNRSSDIIVISVCHGGKLVSMLSPSFQKLIDADFPSTTGTTTQNTNETANDTTMEGIPANTNNRKALMVELVKESSSENPQRGEEWAAVTKAHFIKDSTTVPYERFVDCKIIDGCKVPDAVAAHARSFVVQAWNQAQDGKTPEGSTKMVPFETTKGEPRKCEINVSRHGTNALVSIVRDITERYRWFEAEQRAHAEAVRRQKEAQSQTRFVRHEVKNGLLAGIELCDGLREEIHSAMESILESPTTNTTCTNNCCSCSHKPPSEELPPTANTDSAVSSPASSSSLPQNQLNRNVMKAKEHVDRLDVLLNEALETALAEAFARDVISEIYRPRLERVDVVSSLASYVSRKSGNSNRFNVSVHGAGIPSLQLDPQLLRYIHLNAISNAAKYGKVGGKVETLISYNLKTKLLKMKVINEPGPDNYKLLELGGELANEMVFSQGATLHTGRGDGFLSTGDGAWIMQKCAKTMGGKCTIDFQSEKTVFSFEVPAEPFVSEVVDWKNFVVPKNTIGVAIDDANIQRKLMGRILSHVGVEANQIHVIGKSPDEILALESRLLKLMADNPDSKLLVLIDENLDYSDMSGGRESILLSGSLVLQGILDNMTQEQEDRILALVRSANDSAEDVTQYMERTHGFFPKAPMQKERVREILAPLWTEKFCVKDQHKRSQPLSDSDSDSSKRMRRSRFREKSTSPSARSAKTTPTTTPMAPPKKRVALGQERFEEFSGKVFEFKNEQGITPHQAKWEKNKDNLVSTGW